MATLTGMTHWLCLCLREDKLRLLGVTSPRDAADNRDKIIWAMMNSLKRIINVAKKGL